MSSEAKAAEAWAMLSGMLQASRLVPAARTVAAGAFPLTVVSGFLGAGKTTLLNRLLNEPHGRRIAVLVNDFGRIELDAALIRSWHEDTISLANGCACCSVAGDLVRTLSGLVAREEPPDAIVLEASGVADPRGIAHVALANPALRLDGILTVVDAETLGALLADPAAHDTVEAQLSAADLLVLNKLDLLDGVARTTARAALEAAAPGRPVVATVGAEVPVEVALGIDTRRRLPRPAALGHTDPFESWEFTAAAPLQRAQLRSMLAGLPGGVIRGKGLLCLADAADRLTVYQRVGSRWSLNECGAGDGSSRLVLIGLAGAATGLALREGWEACLT